MKIKTSELTGAALDWAVAKCQDWATEVNDGLIEFQGDLTHYAGDYCNPSGDWAQGGPIIEREGIALHLWSSEEWIGDMGDWEAKGPTPLVAAMRCYVGSKLGNEVEVPEDVK